MTGTSAVPRAPYSLEPTSFPFPALASMAGRAPLGGPREIALACFLIARIVGEAAGPELLTADQRAERVQGVRHWLGAAAIPVAVRNALSKLAEATLSHDRQVMRMAMDSVMAVTANQLESGARLELGRLAQAIAE